MTRVRTIVWGGYLVAVIILSLMPVAVPQTVVHGDKLMHFLAYAGLAALWPRWLGHGPWAAFWASVVGVALEVGQGVLPTGRYMDSQDALANALGASLGVSLMWLGRTWRGWTEATISGGRQ